MIELKLTNTFGGAKTVFKPLHSTAVKLYICGITPYDYSHIGHGRSYVNFDLLVRMLQFCGYSVNHVRNVTDIDDKLLNKAVTAGNILDYTKIAEFFSNDFHGQLTALNCLPPDHEPRATQSIAMMIELIEKLIARNHAYVSGFDVYFDVTSFKTYGQLSGKKLDEMQAGARVEINEKKRNPFDFVLWKGSDHGAFWDSPWGKGRPGWHIECSAMIKKVLGDTVDIHGGGHDLIFPHHENEIAQSECATGKKLANLWLHNGFLNINKEKMSKSLGNMVSLHQLLTEWDPMVLRFYYLQHHYRAPMDFAPDGLAAAQAAYKRLVAAVAGVKRDHSAVTLKSLLSCGLDEWFDEMLYALADDLNSPKMLGILFEHLHELKEHEATRSAVYQLLSGVLGLTCQPLPEKTVTLTPEIEALIAQREQARAAKNWKVADELRAQLASLGYTVQDKKQ